MLRTLFRFKTIINLWLMLIVCGLVGYTHTAQAALVDIMVNQTDSPDPVPSGGTLTYTINVANNGPDDATGVVLTDTIPASS
ncbi:MAG: DUF11 domain-containing protein, partial [Moraxellaceae bacterium]|nr:DUF11 domain-containing protein [Moraxellaceae bacterium]